MLCFLKKLLPSSGEALFLLADATGLSTKKTCQARDQLTFACQVYGPSGQKPRRWGHVARLVWLDSELKVHS